MATVPVSDRIHVTFWGRCNSGKSSLINALAGQEVSIVSEHAGTTTDPVQKPIELPCVGASVLIDTPGLDDESALGEKRIARAKSMLLRSDVAVLLVAGEDMTVERAWFETLRKAGVPVVVVLSQCDRRSDAASEAAKMRSVFGVDVVALSAHTGDGMELLLKKIASKVSSGQVPLTSRVCEDGAVVLLVMPQDSQSPKGRLIKPQVETLRELLDRGCRVMCCAPEEMESTFTVMAVVPHLVITDSQVFLRVYEAVERYYGESKPRITSFSVLYACSKGDIDVFVSGAKTLLALKENSRILIAEACSHIPQNEDIGRVKLPRLIRQRMGEGVTVDVVGGNDFPDNLSGYDMVIHCGACMFNRRHVMGRVARCHEQGVPVTNYGVAIAALSGILDKIVY